MTKLNAATNQQGSSNSGSSNNSSGSQNQGVSGVVVLDVNDPDPNPPLDGVLYFRLTGTVIDTIAPSVPSSLTVGMITASSIQLIWNASTDNVGVTVYQVRTNGNTVATTDSTNYTVTGLSASTSYSFDIRAGDAAGNYSAWSDAVAAGTSASSVGAILCQDAFARPDATGLANVGQNGEVWVAEATDSDEILDANITSQRFVPVLVSGSNHYTHFGTAGNEDIPDDCRIEVVVPYARRNNNYFGIFGRWDGTNGVKAFFSGTPTLDAFYFGNTSSYNDSLTTTKYTMPAEWDDPVDITFALELQGTAVRAYVNDTLIADGVTDINTDGAPSGRMVGFCGEVDPVDSSGVGPGLPWGAITVRGL